MKIRKNVFLGDYTWMKIGGVGDIFVAENSDDVDELLNMNIELIGNGSNVIITDEVHSIFKLGKNFSSIELLDETTIKVGCSALNSTVANFAYTNSIGGMEFLNSIPGSVGGGIKMNAGAYGLEYKDIIVSVYDYKNKYLEDIKFDYRKCSHKNTVFGYCILRGIKKDKSFIRNIMDKNAHNRFITQPIKVKTSGSTFKNPNGLSAWKLIDEAGFRGYKIGDAQVSEKHCNFIINNGNANVNDVISLIEDIIYGVKEKTKITLEKEVIIL